MTRRVPEHAFLPNRTRPLGRKAWLCAISLSVIGVLGACGAEDSPAASVGIPTLPQFDSANGQEAGATGAPPSRDLKAAQSAASGTNAAPSLAPELENALEIARHLHLERQLPEATTAYAAILTKGAPEPVQRTCLLALAQIAQVQNDAPRAEQIYAQYLSRWPRDDKAPEILLAQGVVYRQMGLHRLAIAKFYAVMTSALGLKPDRFDYYRRVVLEAQNEIATTEFDLADWPEATASFGKLLKLEPPPANRAVLQYKYIRCLLNLGRRTEAIAQGEDFLTRFPDSPQRPEIQFLRASALKETGRDNEALQQVVKLLQEQHSGNTNDPATLQYWQHRAGNEIANKFYQEGETMKALDIYLSLAALDSRAEWQLPVCYQIGLIFEQLNQPAKAIEYYETIANRSKDLSPNPAPSLKTVLEMAAWRKNFLRWQLKTQAATLQFRATLDGTPQTNAIPNLE